MKIFKSPAGIVFDTEAPEKMTFDPGIKREQKTFLSFVISTSEYDFLSEYFKPINQVPHPIFSDFGNSYFYAIVK
jgi:hypothetical protein